MKIDKSYIYFLILVAFVISVLLNIKSCNTPPKIIYDDTHKKIDSLMIVCNNMNARFDSVSVHSDKLSEEVLSLNSERSRMTEEMRKKDEIIRKSKLRLAENDRMIAKLKKSKVDMSDEDLSDAVRLKLPK